MIKGGRKPKMSCSLKQKCPMHTDIWDSKNTKTGCPSKFISYSFDALNVGHLAHCGIQEDLKQQAYVETFQAKTSGWNPQRESFLFHTGGWADLGLHVSLCRARSTNNPYVRIQMYYIRTRQASGAMIQDKVDNKYTLVELIRLKYGF